MTGAFLLLLWIISLTTNKHKSDISIEDRVKFSSEKNNFGKLNLKIHSQEFLQPLRRGPVPFSRDARDDTFAENENVAKEILDGPRNVDSLTRKKDGNKDENTAGEEHSAEFNDREKVANVKSIETIRAKEQKNISNKEFEDQEESFHQLQEIPVENPIESEKNKYIQDLNWIANINSKVKPPPIHTIDESKVLQKRQDRKHSNVNFESSHANRVNFVHSAVISKEKVEQEESFHQLPEHQKDLPEDIYGSYNNWRNFSTAEIGKLSILGRRLYLNEKNGQEQNEIFTIHVWKHIRYVAGRLLKARVNKSFNPFDDCSVSNCRLTFGDKKVEKADAVVFHLHRLSGPPINVPRRAGQLWVWMSDESPYNVFMSSKDRILSHYNGYFNWSMTYRIDADVPIPYGRTVPLPKDHYSEQNKDFYNSKSKNIAVLGSNCGGVNHRYKFIAELKNHIPVDIYGRCGTLKCPGHSKTDCKLINDYKFYLSFENSNCDDYITEKVWWNALTKGGVPVVMGATRPNYEQLLPPNSFIYADDYGDPAGLARYLKYLLQHPAQYNAYHEWRRHYRVLNEHGYFQTPIYHFCRLCEALNYNDRSKSHTADLTPYFDKDQHCHAAKWRPSL